MKIKWFVALLIAVLFAGCASDADDSHGDSAEGDGDTGQGDDDSDDDADDDGADDDADDDADDTDDDADDDADDDSDNDIDDDADDDSDDDINDVPGDYVAVTSSAVRASVDVLLQYRETQGYRVRVVDLDDVTGQGTFEENLRAVLADMYAPPAEGEEKPYLLLVGGYGTIPMPVLDGDPHSGNDYSAASDDYYADVDMEWDQDGDGVLGEWNADVTTNTPEYVAGRIPTDDAPVAAAIAQRIIAFEQDGVSAYKNDALLGAGIAIRELEREILHGKVMLIDGERTVIGSANLDQRSFHRNYELNSIIDDRTFGRQIRKMFMKDFEHSRRITREGHERRGMVTRFLERVIDLFGWFL